MDETILAEKMGEAVGQVIGVILLILGATWLYRRVRGSGGKDSPQESSRQGGFTHAPYGAAHADEYRAPVPVDATGHAPAPQGAGGEHKSASMKCPQCGLVNFTTAEWCKRCGLSFTGEEPQDSAAWVPAWAGASSYAPGFAPAFDEGPKDERLAKFSSATPIVGILLMVVGKNVHFGLPVMGLLTLLVGLVAGVVALARIRRNGAVYGGGRAAKVGVAVNAAMFLLFGVVPLAYLMSLRGAFAATRAPEWREYKSPQDGFNVQMPGEPVVKEKTINVPNMGAVPGKMAVVNLGDNGSCMVGLFDYGRYTGDLTNADFSRLTEQMLDESVKRIETGSKFTTLSRKSITLDGYQGVELEGLPPDEVRGSRPMYDTFRVYIVPPRMYFLSIGGPLTGDLYKQKDKFLNSFQLLSAGELRSTGSKLTTRDAEVYNKAREWIDAAARGNTSTLQKKIAAGEDVNQLVDGQTALTKAARAGHTDTVKALIAARANLNVKEEQFGATALWLATLDRRNADIVQLLVNAGADLNLRARDGGTPVQHAARLGYTDTVKALIAGGADLNIRDNEGKTALAGAKEIAAMNPNNAKLAALVETIRAAGGRE